MKSNYLKIVMLLIIVLVVLFYLSATNTAVTVEKEAEGSKNKPSQHLNRGKVDDKGPPFEEHVGLITSKEINDFNVYLEDNLDTMGLSKNKTIVSGLIETIDENTIDNAANELKNIRLNPENHQLELRRLNSECYSLKIRINNKIKDSTFGSLKKEYFFHALQKSGYCSLNDITQDPFFIMLDLARKGNKLSQLWLIVDLHGAIMRGVIDPQLFPLEYSDLRNESMNYIKSLAARGVKQASITLSNLYYSNKFLIPQDNVLQYFYLALAEKQNNNNPISAGFNSDESYDMLNDQEKQHADRMTKQLK